MDRDKRLELQRIAAELDALRDAAVALGEPFLGYMIDMARIEALSPGGKREPA